MSSDDPWLEAKEYGIDVDLLRHQLTLSYEERISRHQRALELYQEIIKAREKLYGKTSPTAQSSQGQRD